MRRLGHDTTRPACRWATPEMAMKYARQTGGMGLRMVQELARDLAEGWDPLMKDAPIVSFGGRDRGQQPKGAPLVPTDLAPEILQLINELEVDEHQAIVETEDTAIYYNSHGYDWAEKLADTS